MPRPPRTIEKGWTLDRLSHRLNDTITARRIDLADKHERQMQVSRRDPFQRGSAGRVERDPETSLLFRVWNRLARASFSSIATNRRTIHNW